MLILLSNSRPYLNISDDVLAQVCQFSLTFAMSIGLLEKASESFQDDVFGYLLVIGTSLNLGMAFFVILFDLFTAIFPEKSKKFLTKIKAKKRASKNKIMNAPRMMKKEKLAIQNTLRSSTPRNPSAVQHADLEDMHPIEEATRASIREHPPLTIQDRAPRTVMETIGPTRTLTRPRNSQGPPIGPPQHEISAPEATSGGGKAGKAPNSRIVQHERKLSRIPTGLGRDMHTFDRVGLGALMRGAHEDDPITAGPVVSLEMGVGAQQSASTPASNASMTSSTHVATRLSQFHLTPHRATSVWPASETAAEEVTKEKRENTKNEALAGGVQQDQEAAARGRKKSRRRSSAAVDGQDVTPSRRKSKGGKRRKKRKVKVDFTAREGETSGTPQPEPPGDVDLGEETSQALALLKNGDLTMAQAGDPEDGANTHSKKQRMPLSFDDMDSSDEQRLDSGAHLAGQDTAMLTPVEEPKVQNASSQAPPNMIGVIAKFKVKAANKRKANVQKMPATDRNL